MEYLAKKPSLVIFLITFLTVIILDKGFNIDDSILRIAIAAPLAVILSPRKKKIETQSGVKIQITWIFLKNPVIIN